MHTGTNPFNNGPKFCSFRPFKSNSKKNLSHPPPLFHLFPSGPTTTSLPLEVSLSADAQTYPAQAIQSGRCSATLTSSPITTATWPMTSPSYVSLTQFTPCQYAYQETLTVSFVNLIAVSQDGVYLLTQVTFLVFISY